MRGIIYTRVSSEEQVRGTSLDSQEEACRRYCSEKNIEVLALFREEGASAKSANRAQFLRAIDFCRKQKPAIDAFVVAKVDRFARNTEDHFTVRKILTDYGTQLHSVSEPIGDDPTSKLFETILAGFSDFDNAIRRQRSIDGLSAKINQGLYPRKPPIGYLSGYANRKRLKKTEPDQIDPETFPILRRALGEFAQGLFTRSQLRARLDDLGLSVVRGRKTYSQLVDQILAPSRLKFYAGILENPWTGKDVPGLHRPLLSRATYHRILERLGNRKAKPRWQHTAPDFPLRRTVQCVACQTPFQASFSKGHGGTYGYYRCARKGCTRSGKSVRRKRIEGAFVDLLNGISVDDRFTALFQGTAEHLLASRMEETRAAREKVNRTRSALKARRRRIYAMAEEGLYDAGEVDNRIADLDRRLKHLDESVASKAFNGELSQLAAQALQFHRSLGTAWRQLPLRLQQHFQEFVFPEGVVFDHENGEFRTSKTPDLFRGLEPFSREFTSRVRQTSAASNGSDRRPEDTPQYELDDMKEQMRVWIEFVIEAMAYLGDHVAPSASPAEE